VTQIENVATLRRYHERLNSTGELPVELFHPEGHRRDALEAAGMNDERRTT
jgi:hypothetical protein